MRNELRGTVVVNPDSIDQYPTERGDRMLAPYGLRIIESCITCNVRPQRSVCNVSNAALQAFEQIKYVTPYPKGAVLFVEGQMPRGVYVLCKGRAKLAMGSTTGKSFTLRIAEPGEVLGLSATVGHKPYELTAETIEPCQVNFVKGEDFLLYLREHADACLRVAEQLSERYINTCRGVRNLGLSHSAGHKLAKLLLDLTCPTEAGKPQSQLKLVLTHDEIAHMIGISRETVTRLLSQLKKRQIVQVRGSTLFVLDRVALRMIAGEEA